MRLDHTTINNVYDLAGLLLREWGEANEIPSSVVREQVERVFRPENEGQLVELVAEVFSFAYDIENEK
jgi:hypothetical protein